MLFGDLEEQAYLHKLSSKAFADAAAAFLATLNAIHPFREGNGCAQNAFLTLIAERVGHPLALERLEPDRFLAATIASFHGDEAPLRGEIRRLID